MDSSNNITNRPNLQRAEIKNPPSWTPDLFKIPDLVRQIFDYLSSKELGTFELLCKSHLVSTSSAWQLLRTKKGFLYDWTSPYFPMTSSCQEKQNYFLSQMLENFMSTLPKKRVLKKMSNQLQSFYERFPVFQTFTQDILALRDAKIHNFKNKIRYSAAPANRYQTELILHTVLNMYFFIKLSINYGRSNPLQEKPIKILNLASDAILQGATFISRLATTLAQNQPYYRAHHSYYNKFDRYRTFLRNLALKAEARGDLSGQEKLLEYAEGLSFDNQRLEGLLIKKSYGNLTGEEEVALASYLFDLEQMPLNSSEQFTWIFTHLVEAEEYEIAEKLLDRFLKTGNKLLMNSLLLAIEVKTHFGKFEEANGFYDLIFKRQTSVRNNISFLIAMAELKFQLKDYEKADLYLNKYWNAKLDKYSNTKKWHSHIFCGMNNRRWGMMTEEAYKNEEFQALIEWTIAIKDQLNDQQGVEFFRNLLQLIHLDLRDVQACVAAHRKWERQGFYDEIGQESKLPDILYFKMCAIMQLLISINQNQLLINQILWQQHILTANRNSKET